mmetsp:Transcript_16356/g.35529  ORF Transcript_16356/g.35529 Transcript_16356/m.35529 type:complete len:435 (+) Transcript_16356:41-1345(+)
MMSASAALGAAASTCRSSRRLVAHAVANTFNTGTSSRRACRTTFRSSSSSIALPSSIPDGTLTAAGVALAAIGAYTLASRGGTDQRTTGIAVCENTPEKMTRKIASMNLSESSRGADTQPTTEISITEPSSSPPVPSRGRRLLSYLRLLDLPTPRRLVSSDPAFEWPSMKSGVRQRAKDEARLRALQTDAIEARQSGDVERINAIFQRISSIAYGEGVTPQAREDFLIRYGCTGWTEDVLDYIVALASDRGIVEIGSGNGQWARAILDRHEEMVSNISNNGIGTNDRGRRRKTFELVLPYDDMSDLPLSPKVYHRHTQPHSDYMMDVRKCNSPTEVLRKWESRGRILMLVFPPPGPFALDCVKAYVDTYEGNDTVIYVGEGRGGANGNEELFTYFCGGDWALEKVMDVKPSPGGKGYERMFVLRKVKDEAKHTR